MEVLQWTTVKEYDDITYQKAKGVARIAFNRPEVRNAFRPQTIDEMIEAFNHVWHDQQVGTILLTGNGPAKDGKFAFCSGGDQRVRGHGGYVDNEGVARLNVLQLPPYTTAIATQVLNHICHLCCTWRQCMIVNLLSEARDQTHVLMDISRVLNRLSHDRNS